jgi:ribonuclease HI
MEGEHVNSTESEWASVLDGLQFSITKDQGAVEIENDNLAVIEAIIRRRAKKEVERYYLHTILEESADLEWLAIRWIPRELNRADTLFR